MDSPAAGVTSAGAMRPFVKILWPLVFILSTVFNLSNTIDSFIIYNLFLYSPKLVVVGKIDERRIVRISPNFLCTLPMDVAWFFSGVIPHPHGNILCTSGLVDDVILSGK